MPFLFKLSKRVARLKDRLAAVSAALLAVTVVFACEKPLNVTDPGAGSSDVSRLVVFPKALTIQQNQTVDFTAVGLTTGGDTATVTVSWSVTGGSITDMSSTGGRHYGRYKAAADTGRVKVVAKGQPNGVADTATVTITATPVAAVSVSPMSASVTVGQTVQLAATTTDAAGNVLSGRAVAWTSSDLGVATVSSSGLVSALAVGSATLTATSEGHGATVALTVSSVPVASVVVSPASSSAQVGASVQFTAVPKDLAGNALTGRAVSWASSNGSVVTVSGTGLVTGVAAGMGTITATTEGKSGTATVTVTSIPVASVSLSPASASVSVGQTAQFVATPKDANGNALPGRTVTWGSSGSSVATVSGSGLATGAAAGSATITATSEGKTGSATITVTAPPPPPQTGECAALRTGWVWCDDFEQDRLSSYFEYDNAGGSFVRTAGVGYGSSTGMRVQWATGQVNGGALHLGLGKTPSASIRPVDGGTATYRELYWRMYERNQAGWSGGGGDKLSRVQILASGNWAQAMIAPVWSGDQLTNRDYLLLDPVTGTDDAGNLVTTAYGDVPHLRFLGAAQSRTALFATGNAGVWRCIEAHVRLNDAGQTNGVFELWIDGTLEAQRSGLNWVGAYSAYGLNTVFFENYWNAGAAQPEARDIDNLVVSTQPIGCVGSAPPPPPPLPVTQPGVVSDLAVVGTTDSAATLSFTEVSGGAGAAASYDVRYAVGSIAWGSALGVGRESCASPVAGAAIGARRTCTVLGLSPGTTYDFQLVAFRGTLRVDAVFGELSNVANGTTSLTVTQPGVVSDLAVVGTTDSAATLSFTEVSGGAGASASYDVRYAVGSIAWGSALGVRQGSCASPVAGAVIGARRTCTVLGLSSGTTYDFELVAFRGTLRVDAVFGDLSNVANGTTTSSGGSPGIPGSSGQGWWVEDFSTYVSTVDLLANPLGFYSVGEDVATGQMALDGTTGYGTSRQSMRYDFPDRSGDGARCGDYPVGRNINLPSTVQEVWVEAYVKFAANFRTLAPSSWGCISNAEYKFIFARVNGGSRFNLNSGTYGSAWTFGIPFDEQGAGGTPRDVVPGADGVWDGQWHQYRLYFKVSSTAGASDGAARFYLDGVLVKAFTNVNIPDSGIYGLALGRNMNQGPAQPTSVWWGRIQAWNQNPGW